VFIFYQVKIVWRFKNYIVENTLVEIEYTYVYYKIDFWNEITLHNIQYSHEIINMVKDGKVCSYEILYTF